MKNRNLFIACIAIGLCVAVGTTILTVSGCLPLKEHSAEIHQTVSEILKDAYDSGGAEKVASRIDGLVTEGKLTETQAGMLKEQLQTGYDKLQEKLGELANGQTEQTAVTE